MATDFRENAIELTAAGLFETFTRFPFHSQAVSRSFETNYSDKCTAIFHISKISNSFQPPKIQTQSLNTHLERSLPYNGLLRYCTILNFNLLSNWIMHQNLPPSIPLGRSTQNKFSQSPQCHNLYFYFNTIYITLNKSFTLIFNKNMIKPNLFRSKILTVDLSITGNLATFTTNFFP